MPATGLEAVLVPRQARNCTRTEDGFLDEDSCYVPFWYTRTGVILKWSLFFGLVILIVLYLIGGYLHAKKRIRQGLAPMGYHRFMVNRTELGRVDSRYAPPPASTFYYTSRQDQAYDMYAAPPPVYDPSAPRPPTYEGPAPAGATKTDPNQQTTTAPPNAETSRQQGASNDYAPPSGPPPLTTAGGPPDYAPPPGPPPPSTVRPQGTGTSNNPFLS